MDRVVVEKCQLFGARLLGQRKGLLIGRVAKAGVGLVLLCAVLRVVHEQIRVATPVRHVLERAVLLVGEHCDLVVGGKTKPR